MTGVGSMVVPAFWSGRAGSGGQVTVLRPSPILAVA